MSEKEKLEEIPNQNETIIETSGDSTIIDNDHNHLLSNSGAAAAAESNREEGSTSTLGAIFLIINAALGAGLLNFPKSFDTAGG